VAQAVLSRLTRLCGTGDPTWTPNCRATVLPAWIVPRELVQLVPEQLQPLELSAGT
jgi:hypothetical protein